MMNAFTAWDFGRFHAAGLDALTIADSSVVAFGHSLASPLPILLGGARVITA